MSEALIRLDGVAVSFNGQPVLDDVQLSVQPGEIVTLIGPNGAGKTTVFNCLTGFYQPSSGSIRLNGEAIEGLPGHKIARKGVVRTFQNVRLFKDMTAVENLLVAQHRHLNTGYLAGLFKTPAFRRSEREAMEYAAYWLEQVDLVDFANRSAGTLAYGQQRRLEIARCMMTRPRILMLDEPAAGLNPKETEDLKALIAMLRDEHGVTVLLIEHHMDVITGICDRMLALNYGEMIGSGVPADVVADVLDVQQLVVEQHVADPEAHEHDDLEAHEDLGAEHDVATDLDAHADVDLADPGAGAALRR